MCHEHVNNQIKYSLASLAIGIDLGDFRSEFYRLVVVLVSALGIRFSFFVVLGGVEVFFLLLFAHFRLHIIDFGHCIYLHLFECVVFDSSCGYIH